MKTFSSLRNIDIHRNIQTKTTFNGNTTPRSQAYKKLHRNVFMGKTTEYLLFYRVKNITQGKSDQITTDLFFYASSFVCLLLLQKIYM